MNRLGLLAVVGALVVAGCGEGSERSSTVRTKTPHAQATTQASKSPLSPEERPSAYARQISGGSYEYSGVGAAAMSGCLEALLGEHIGIPGRSYRDEFPEPRLQRIYRQAKRDCG